MFIPQMKPMQWMLISLTCYIIYMMIIISINTLPVKLNFKMKKAKIFKKKWNWLW